MHSLTDAVSYLLTCSFFSRDHLHGSMQLVRATPDSTQRGSLHLNLLHVQALKAKRKDEGEIKTSVTVLGSYVPLASNYIYKIRMEKVKDLLTLALVMCMFLYIYHSTPETTHLKTSLPPDVTFPAASAYLISSEIPHLPQITVNI